MSKPPSMPTPIKLQRKLRLSSERVVELQERAAALIACTKRQTGCPIHTC